jgi:hypothetical protein
MKRRLTALILGIITLLPLASATAYTPQSVYTYDFYGNAVPLKEMYDIGDVLTGDDMGAGTLSSPQGLYIGADGLIYLCDSGNGRVLVLDEEYQVVREIKNFTRPDGSADTLNYPTDVCLSSTGELYIADQRGQRIVVIGEDGNMTAEIKDVTSDVLAEGYQFKPSKLVLDSTDRLYVVATGVTSGIMELNMAGSVVRFVGAAKVHVNLLDYIWKLIGTEEQYNTMARAVPTEYNNITLSDEDFLFGTISVVSSESIQNVITSSLYYVHGIRIMPETISEWLKRVTTLFNTQVEAGYTIKKLNLKGNDILRRNGFQAPIGDIQFYLGGDTAEYSQGYVTTEVKASMDNMTDTTYIAVTDIVGTTRGASQFVDVAVHRSGLYSVLDQRRGRIFTYDEDGVLLYVFGGKGNAQGLFTMPVAITYKGDNILVLDSLKNSLTVFTPTCFVIDIYSAYDAYAASDFETSLALWNETIRYCSNFNIGYIGAGQSLLRLGQYTEAMEMFRLADYREGYDKAFVLYRGELIKSNIGYALGLLALLAVLIVVLKKLLRKRKKPLRGVRSPRLIKYLHELSYAKYTSFHPFDGFYDLKFENRGSVAAATTILAANVFIAILGRQLTAFTFNANVLKELDILSILISVALPVLLFAVANWCITTLLDGEGSIRNIYICICYAMFPSIFISLAGIAVSNIIAIREMAILTVFDGLSTLWFGFLLFFGIGVTHQYKVKRNILSLLLTVVGMLVIIFIVMLFFTLMEKMYSFVLTLSNEIMLRN